MSTDLSKFITEQRERFEVQDNNLFAFSFGEVDRYLTFLSIINNRLRAAGAQYKVIAQQMKEAFSGNGGTVNHEQAIILTRSSQLGNLIHLDQESFYLFAKILLDKIGQSIEFYFGQVRSCSLHSHHRLVDNFENYANQKSITLPQDLHNLAKKLKEDVSDYRDKQITHNASARNVRGYGVDESGNPLTTIGKLYPKEGDTQTTSKTADNLLRDVDTYVIQVINLISTNQDKTRLKLEPARDS